MSDPFNIGPIGAAIVKSLVSELKGATPEVVDKTLQSLSLYRLRVKVIDGGIEATIDRRVVDGLEVVKE